MQGESAEQKTYTFTYDQTPSQTTAQNLRSTTSGASPKAVSSTKKKAAAHYLRGNFAPSNGNSTSKERPKSRSPLRAPVNGSKPITPRRAANQGLGESAIEPSRYSGTQGRPQVIQPDLPQALEDEFQQVPENYPALPAALHNPKQWTIALNKWKEIGVIHAHEIVKEG